MLDKITSENKLSDKEKITVEEATKILNEYLNTHIGHIFEYGKKDLKGCVGKSYKDKDGKIKYLNSYSSEIQGGDWYGYCMADDCDHYYAREYHICNLETEEWSNYKCLIGETNIPGACDEI